MGNPIPDYECVDVFCPFHLHEGSREPGRLPRHSLGFLLGEVPESRCMALRLNHEIP